MKKIALLFVTLIVIVTAWGWTVLTYANTTHAHAQVQPTATTQVIADKQATVPPDLKGSVFFQGSTNLREVALTFDDGPSPAYTPQVLTVLQRYQVHATFFTLGELDDVYPNLIQQEHAAGHIVGNHSWNHPDLTTRSSDFVHAQIVDTSRTIKQATGEQPEFFRPPYGSINADVKAQIAQADLLPVMWNVDTIDWSRPGTDAIVNTALNTTSNGSIILMHDGGGDRSQTIAALPRIIKGLQQHGFQLVTVQQLVNDTQKSGTN